jgi:hypothetical protein
VHKSVFCRKTPGRSREKPQTKRNESRLDLKRNTPASQGKRTVASDACHRDIVGALVEIVTWCRSRSAIVSDPKFTGELAMVSTGFWRTPDVVNCRRRATVDVSYNVCIRFSRPERKASTQAFPQGSSSPVAGLHATVKPKDERHIMHKFNAAVGTNNHTQCVAVNFGPTLTVIELFAVQPRASLQSSVYFCCGGGRRHGKVLAGDESVAGGDHSKRYGAFRRGRSTNTARRIVTYHCVWTQIQLQCRINPDFNGIRCGAAVCASVTRT